MELDKIPTSIQAACAYIARPVLSRIGIKYEMRDICRELKMEHTSVLGQVRSLTQAIFNNPTKEESKREGELQRQLRESLFLKDIYQYQVDNPNCWVKAERHQMTADFKILILTKKVEYALDWDEVSHLLGIPEDTLKKLKGQHEGDKKGKTGGGSPLIALPDAIVEKLSRFFKGRSSKATVKDFCAKNPEVLRELNLDYREFSGLLMHLGFTSPKGIFLPNTGLDRIERFSPNVIWGTDGKNMNIVINGESFRWVWQCLIDYKTTVLVGGVVEKSETTENLLKAIGESKERSGVSPMAIVLDNRLSENMPAISTYLEALGIEIIKTFPGNSKSNGIIENNFRVFDQWVLAQGGTIEINASSPEELSRAVAQLLTEVFTQMRNLAPRKSLGGKSALEVSKAYPPPSGEERSLIQEKIKALANRFKNELSNPIWTEAKELAFKMVLEVLKPPSPDVFRKRLFPAYYTADLILQALAILKTQKQKHPEKTFDHTYFGGILRNLADQQNLESLHLHLEATYPQFWKALEDTGVKKNFKPQSPLAKALRLTDEYLNAKIPAQGTLALLYLKNIFMFIAGGSIEAARGLRIHLTGQIQKAKRVSHAKRENILRKLYEIETFIHLMKIESSNVFQNASKVFGKSADQTVTT